MNPHPSDPSAPLPGGTRTDSDPSAQLPVRTLSDSDPSAPLSGGTRSRSGRSAARSGAAAAIAGRGEAPPRLTLRVVSKVAGSVERLAILRELCRESPLPTNVLARRIGRSADAVHKHLRVLKAAGVLRVGHGRLYGFAPAFRPAPGSAEVDLGHCLLRLDRA